MTQTITPNHDPRYTVIFVERGHTGQPLSLVEEPVTAWLHQLDVGAIQPSQQPLHPSNGIKGDRYLKSPTGRLVDLATGKPIGAATLLLKYRQEHLPHKQVSVLDPSEWGHVFDVLDAA